MAFYKMDIFSIILLLTNKSILNIKDIEGKYPFEVIINKSTEELLGFFRQLIEYMENEELMKEDILMIENHISKLENIQENEKLKQKWEESNKNNAIHNDMLMKVFINRQNKKKRKAIDQLIMMK